MMLWSLLLGVAMAGVRLDVPDAQYSANSGTLVVALTDDGEAPPLAALISADMSLCTFPTPGGTLSCAISLGKSLPLTPDALRKEFPLAPLASQGGPGNYVVRLEAKDGSGKTQTRYSDWFAIVDMKGAQGANAGNIKGGPSGTASKTSKTALVPTLDNTNEPYTSTFAQPWMTPYRYQTGLTRFAPPQKSAVDKVTRDKASRRYPTSSYSVFMSNINIPMPITTLTPDPVTILASLPNDAPTQTFEANNRQPARVTAKRSRGKRRWAD